MRFLGVRRQTDAGKAIVSDIGKFQREDGRSFEVHISRAANDDWPTAANSDGWFILGFCFAAAAGEHLQHPDVVDRHLLRNLQSLSAQWAQWMPSLKPVVFDGIAAEDRPYVRNGSVGSFYSGGIDSLQTAIAHSPRVDALITVGHEPFDIFKIEQRLTQLEDVSDYAIKSQRHHLKVITNVMTVMPELHDRWAYIFHGPVYLGLANFFGGLSEAVLSSTHSYGDLMPWGSHPLTDGLVSSQSLRATHFGATYTRVEKTAMIADDLLALSSLNVCANGRVEPFGNCSHCQKCLRTMGTLDLLGVDRAAAVTFDWSDYAPHKLGDIFLRSHNEASFYREMIAAADVRGRTDIADACHKAIRRGRLFSAISSAELKLRMRYPKIVEHRSTLLKVRHSVYKALGLKRVA